MLKRICQLVCGLTTAVLSILFGVLVLMIFTQVVLRFGFSSSLLWVEELGRFIFMWLMCLGISIGIYHKKQIAVTFLIDRLPTTAQRMSTIVATGIVALFFLSLAVLGFDFSVRNIAAESSVLFIPMGYVYMILPVSAVLCSLYCLEQIVDTLSESFAEEVKR